MKYTLEDVITIDSNKVEDSEKYFFGNNREELVNYANSPDAKSFYYKDITADIFYVPDFITRNSKYNFNEDTYKYAIPESKPFIPRSMHKVNLSIQIEGEVEDHIWAKTKEEAFQIFKKKIEREIQIDYPMCKVNFKEN